MIKSALLGSLLCTGLPRTTTPDVELHSNGAPQAGVTAVYLDTFSGELHARPLPDRGTRRRTARRATTPTAGSGGPQLRPGPASPSALIGLDALDQVFAIDPASAEVFPLGTLSGIVGGALGSFDRAPNGDYYAVTHGTAELHRIDPITWEATHLGTLIDTFNFEGGLAIDSNDIAWWVNGGTSNAAHLYRVDLSDATATLIGSMGAHDINGLDLRSDGMLIGLDRVTSSLVEIDPTTAVVTQLAPVSSTIGAAGGLVIQADRGYFATAGLGHTLPGADDLTQFDPFSGAQTVVGVFSDAGQHPFGILGLEGGGTLGTTFCTTTANSTGSPADIEATGSSSSSAGDLTLEAAPVPNQSGIFYHATTPIQVPFGNGFNCVGGNTKRGKVVSASGNLASYTYDNSILKRDLSAHIGSIRNFQYWYRDPMGGGAFFNTSNAIAIFILP